jgi:hypothetical protein
MLNFDVLNLLQTKGPSNDPTKIRTIAAKIAHSENKVR